MNTLVHERIYMEDKDRESLSTYETALCKYILDVH